MSNIRAGITFVIVLLIVLLSVFQMQLRGYEKVGRINEWILYYKNETCATAEEEIYQDESYTYYLGCISSDQYLVKSGFQEVLLKEALEQELITIEDLVELEVVFQEENIE